MSPCLKCDKKGKKGDRIIPLDRGWYHATSECDPEPGRAWVYGVITGKELDDWPNIGSEQSWWK